MFCRLALYAIMLDIFLNLIVPSVDIFTDLVFYVGNMYELHVTQEKNVLQMESIQELCKLEYIYSYKK